MALTKDQREVVTAVTREQVILDVLEILKARVTEQIGGGTLTVDAANAALHRTLVVYAAVVVDDSDYEPEDL